MTKTKHLHIRVSPELKARLKAIAVRLKCYESDIVTTGTEKETRRLEKQAIKRG